MYGVYHNGDVYYESLGGLVEGGNSGCSRGQFLLEWKI